MNREDFQWKNKEHILELEQFHGEKGQELPLLHFPLLLAHTGVKNAFRYRLLESDPYDKCPAGG